MEMNSFIGSHLGCRLENFFVILPPKKWDFFQIKIFYSNWPIWVKNGHLRKFPNYWVKMTKFSADFSNCRDYYYKILHTLEKIWRKFCYFVQKVRIFLSKWQFLLKLSFWKNHNYLVKMTKFSSFFSQCRDY